MTELLHGCSKYLKNLDRFTLVTSILKGLLAEFQRLLQTKQTGCFNNTNLQDWTMEIVISVHRKISSEGRALVSSSFVIKLNVRT